jgi:hypothetical protein
VKFKLIEKVLTESTYGLDKKYTNYHLMRIALSDRILFQILDGKELLPGFTIYSNRRGSGIQKKLGTSSILHHIELTHEESSKVKELENLSSHNKIHNDIFELIKNYLMQHEEIFIKCYEIYEQDYNSANALFLNSDDNNVYTAIGLKFKASEDYFRNLQQLLLQKVDLSALKSSIITIINDYNSTNNLESEITDKEAREIIYA